MSASNQPPTPPATLSIRYDPGRATRQLIGFGAATAIMIGLAALGVFMIVASFIQVQAVGTFIGVAFGILFILVSLVSLVSCAEILTRIIRWSRQTSPLVSLDAAGITGFAFVGGREPVDSDGPITWSNIKVVRLESSEPRLRRSKGLANLDVNHRLRMATKNSLDRTAGLGLGMRDGTRWMGIELTDGRKANFDLRLPMSPESFSLLASQIADHVRAHNPHIVLLGVTEV
ncbi:hypothetical protein CGQ24_10445 [Arthrobacter sp. 7749]|nr:hypothetical protein CGQ24_10445 [Arthrobacter sp. 7749]